MFISWEKYIRASTPRLRDEPKPLIANTSVASGQETIATAGQGEQDGAVYLLW